jgi:hypothetical protein
MGCDPVFCASAGAALIVPAAAAALANALVFRKVLRSCFILASRFFGSFTVNLRLIGRRA